jgi:hypothetical protein
MDKASSWTSSTRPMRSGLALWDTHGTAPQGVLVSMRLTHPEQNQYAECGEQRGCQKAHVRQRQAMRDSFTQQHGMHACGKTR